MTWVIEAAAFLTIALLINSYSRANPEWVTIEGNVNDPTSDSLELSADPMGLGDIDSVQLRLNRAQPMPGTQGIPYRSFRGTISVDCKSQSARYIHGIYYSEPNFGGTPVAGRSFDEKENVPLRLTGFGPDAVDKVIRASCDRYVNNRAAPAPKT